MHSVLVNVLAGTGWIRQEVAAVLPALAADDRFEVQIGFRQTGPSAAAARNEARLAALELGADYLVTIDDDNPPPPNVLDLCAMGLDVVGCPTPVWQERALGTSPWHMNVLVEAGECRWRPLQDVARDRCQGLVEVDAIGGGVTVISRRVLEAVPAPWANVYDEEGRLLAGEDYEASRRWRAAGFKVWAHFDYVCRHFAELEILNATRYLHEAAARVIERRSSI